MNLREQIQNNAEPFTIAADAPLLARNTFGVQAHANLLVDVRNAEALTEVLAIPAIASSTIFVLGEGSNVLFTRDFGGVILSMKNLGIRVLDDDGETGIIRAEAGENWHQFVQWTLGHGWLGLENLSLIPGTVGASPIQNIGAYGVEVGDHIHAVEAFDRQSRQAVRFTRPQCEFAYRHSVFKHDPSRYIVTAVEFQLTRSTELKLDYAGIRDELAAMRIESPNALQVAEAVCRVRTRKLPNPLLIGNAGSFFKNPVVDESIASALKSQHEKLPVFPSDVDSKRKLSAAWLIERAGWKGFREGDAGVSDQHALVLVNHGKASGLELATLALKIRADVEQQFGVRLEAEPIVL